MPSQPYLGEIMMFGGNFAPQGWAFCNGQLLAIAQNDVLFTLIGTTYGGDGQTTFALPDLRSRAPVHNGNDGSNTYVEGQTGGVESVALTANQMPLHTHTAQGNSGTGDAADPGGNVWAASSLNQFTPNVASAPMNAAAVGAAGSGQAHSNLMPHLAVNYVISLLGIFPSQN